MNDTATQEGAARTEPQVDPDVKKDEIPTRPNPREAALEAMAERQEQERRRELDEALAADPDLAAAWLEHGLDHAGPGTSTSMMALPRGRP